MILKHKIFTSQLILSISEKTRSITRQYADYQFPILKEEIPLKKLDFQSRNILIKNYGVYKENKFVNCKIKLDK
ncbi:exotoxin beta-grasp domain-containing protein [Staphylococcus aureus]|uniref:exotoxin beta-grasp domain-containing protein n=1 Tax=Staphylococcus aureus TaxID=1280 RepID=UPI0035D04B53